MSHRKNFDGLLVQRGAVYTSDDLVGRLRIGKQTLQKWLNEGLPFAQPSTKSQLFIGDDVVDWLQSRTSTRSTSRVKMDG